MTDIIALARRHKHIASHYEGCEADHIGCLVNRLADEVERLRAEIERLGASILSLAKSLRASLDAAIRQRDEARAEIERLRVDLATQQNCCDGAAAQDAHVRREREEHRAEVEKLRAEIERLKQEPELLRAELIALTNAARKALANAYDRARNAPEGKP